MKHSADFLSRMNFEELITLGEEYRELKAEFSDAIACFEMAQVEAELNDDVSQICTALGQLGLTYRHMYVQLGKEKNLQDAYTSYNLLLNAAKDNVGATAEAIRHISDLKYIEGEYEKALQKAITAYALAKKANRTDMVWFSHGVVKILIKLLRVWLAKERSDLKKAHKNKKPNQIQKRVWQTGYLGDKAKVFLIAPFGWIHGVRGVLLSYFHNLKLRKNR